MSYSVYVQSFEGGEEATMPYPKVAEVLSRHGTLGSAGQYIEFTPATDDLCEIAILSGSEHDGISGVSFERPVASDALSNIIFELLGIPGACFFELDCTYVKARTNVADDLPEGLLEQCESGEITIVTSPEEVHL